MRLAAVRRAEGESGLDAAAGVSWKARPSSVCYGKTEGPTGACGAVQRTDHISTLLLHQPCQLITHSKGVRRTGTVPCRDHSQHWPAPAEARGGAQQPWRSVVEDTRRTSAWRSLHPAAAADQSGAELALHSVSERSGECPLSQVEAGSRAGQRSGKYYVKRT